MDETGIIWGLTRTHSRSPPGTRIADIKPFYRGAKVTAIGAIITNKVLALMTMNDSMDGRAFAVFIERKVFRSLIRERSLSSYGQFTSP